MAAIKKEQPVYTKELIVRANRYIRYIDFLNGNLQDDKTYTIEEVDKLIEKHYGKGKGE